MGYGGMPVCDRCGTSYRSIQRNCPECNKLVNPSAQVWVTGEHPKPKTPKSSYRGSPEPVHDIDLGAGGLTGARTSHPPSGAREPTQLGKGNDRKRRRTVGTLAAPVNKSDQSWTSAYIDLDTRDQTKRFFVVLEDGSNRVLWKTCVFPAWAMKRAHVGKGPRQIHRALLVALGSEGLTVSHFGRGNEWYKARVRRITPTDIQTSDKGISSCQQPPGRLSTDTPAVGGEDRTACLDDNGTAAQNNRFKSSELQERKHIRLVRLSLNQMRFEFRGDGNSKVYASETFPNAHLVEFLGKRFMGHKNLVSVYSNFRTNLDAKGLLQPLDVTQTLKQIVADFLFESRRGSD